MELREVEVTLLAIVPFLLLLCTLAVVLERFLIVIYAEQS